MIQISSATAVGQETIQTVNARELHSFLGSARDFSNWVAERITKYGFVVDVDYTTTKGISNKSVVNLKGAGRPSTEYHISIDMAKQLAMVERNEQGRKARLYFIECEKKLMVAAPTTLPSFPEALRLLADQMEKNATQAIQIVDQTIQINAAAPSVAFVEKYVEADGLKTFRQVAKLLSAPERDFRNFLADRKIMYVLNGAWMHKQAHSTAGRFASKTGLSGAIGGPKTYERSYFTSKGVEWVANLWSTRVPMLRKSLIPYKD